MAELAIDADRQALMSELVDDIEHAVLPARNFFIKSFFKGQNHIDDNYYSASISRSLEASLMRSILIGIGIIGTLWASSVPASAQYRFDRRIDPSNCHWWQVCDYGGRAYLPYRIGSLIITADRSAPKL